MTSMSRAVLRDIACINPPLPNTLPDDRIVSFVPMSELSAETGITSSGQERAFAEVKKGYTPFLRGDLLVAKITPCFENGKIGQVTTAHDVGFGSTEFHVIRTHPEKADSRYLLHYLRQSRIRREGELKMTGSAGQRRVPEHYLRELVIPLPRLPEQRRIAAILDQAEALRAKRADALRKIDFAARAIFLDTFGDPVTNPKGWVENVTLGEVAEVASGITKGRKLNGAATRSIPFMAVVNVQDRYLDLSVIKRIEATESEIERYRLRAGDLLLTEGGDPDKLGRGTLWNDELAECIHQNHVFRVRLKSEEVTPVFLNWLVGSERGKKYFLRSAKQTTGIATINTTQLRSFPLAIPPLELQKAFERAVGRLADVRQLALGSQARLDALFSSLQHRAFRGEL